MIALVVFLVALAVVAYALRTAYLDWENTPMEVCHKYDGQPRLTNAWYGAEFDRRSEARKYARELRRLPLVTDVRVCRNRFVCS